MIRVPCIWNSTDPVQAYIRREIDRIALGRCSGRLSYEEAMEAEHELSDTLDVPSLRALAHRAIAALVDDRLDALRKAG